MVHYYPVSIPYHGSGVNITVQSYAGLLDFGITACRRTLSQEELRELIENMRNALREIEALPAVANTPVAELTVQTPSEKAPSKKKPAIEVQSDTPPPAQ